MHALKSKTARAGAMYVALCAAATWFAEREKLGLCTDARQAVVRELVSEVPRADVLFFGSSQTARGVIPEVFDARYGELTGSEIRSLNLAMLGASRQITFLILQWWLEHHPPPSIVVVESGMQSDRPEWYHELTSRFMDARDARRMIRYRPYLYRDAKEMGRRMRSPPLFDPGGVFRKLDRAALHVELALDSLGRGPEDCVRVAFNYAMRGGRTPYWMPGEPTMLEVIDRHVREDGFYRVEPDSVDGIGGKRKLLEAAAKRDYDTWVRFRWEESGEPDPFADGARFLPTRLYGVWLRDLCNAHGIRLAFADVPDFRLGPLYPKQIEFHRSIAELFIPDRAVLYREESFQDPGHLSLQGAESFTNFLAEFLARPR